MSKKFLGVLGSVAGFIFLSPVRVKEKMLLSVSISYTNADKLNTSAATIRHGIFKSLLGRSALWKRSGADCIGLCKTFW